MLAGLVSEGDIDTATFLVEEDVAISEGEEGVIFPHADIRAGMPLSATLANEDVSCDDGLSAEFFNAETFAIRVATVFNGALSLFMSHE